MHSDLLAVIASYCQPTYQIKNDVDPHRCRSKLTIDTGQIKIKIEFCSSFRSGPINECPLRQFLINIDTGKVPTLVIDFDFQEEEEHYLYYKDGIITFSNQDFTLRSKIAEKVIDWLKQIEAMRPEGKIFS